MLLFILWFFGGLKILAVKPWRRTSCTSLAPAGHKSEKSSFAILSLGENLPSQKGSLFCYTYRPSLPNNLKNSAVLTFSSADQMMNKTGRRVWDSPLSRRVQRGHRLAGSAQPNQFQELPATWVSGASAPAHCFQWVRNIGVITSWENERRGNSISAPPQIGAGGTGYALSLAPRLEREWERSHGVTFPPPPRYLNMVSTHLETKVSVDSYSKKWWNKEIDLQPRPTVSSSRQCVTQSFPSTLTLSFDLSVFKGLWYAFAQLSAAH